MGYGTKIIMNNNNITCTPNHVMNNMSLKTATEGSVYIDAIELLAAN